MPMATIHKVGTGELYHIYFLDQHATDPGYGQGRPGGVDPGYDQGGIRPDRPDQGLPGSGAHPGNRPPGSGNPAFPDNSLPSGPPPHVPAGTTLVLVRDASGVWHYATIQPGSPPPRPVGPGNPNRPDNTLPGGPPMRPDNTLPPTATPKA